MEDKVTVVRCANCIHKPISPTGVLWGFDLEFPDSVCPCQCVDGWYSYMPKEDFFCAYGEKEKEQE